MNFKSSSLKKVLLTTLSLVFFSMFSFAATIKGSVIDGEKGVTMEFVYVFLRKPGEAVNFKGTSTDWDGNYEITGIPAGKYNLVFTNVGYDSVLVADITISSFSDIKTIDITMFKSTEELTTTKITYNRVANNDIVVLKERLEADNVSDPVSQKELKSQGASNVNDATTKIVGATVEGGKYMVMRGLGDRYSITQLNGVTMPSADPYRNSASLDLIPVDMIDNLNTVKTFSADQPGNFTGGKMDINTKSIPSQFYMSFGLSTSYNTQSSFNSNFLSDASRSSTDWLGYDDGLRSRPTAFDTYNEYVVNIGNANKTAVLARAPKYTEERAALNATSKSLNNSYLQTTRQVPMNHGFNFAIGDMYRYGKDSNSRVNKIGINFGMNYSRNYSFFQNQEFGVYEVATGGEDLVPNQSFTMSEGNDETQLGALLSSSIQIKRPLAEHQFTATGMYNHGSENKAVIYEGFWREMAGASFNTRSTSFIERDVQNAQLRGQHMLGAVNGIKIDWTASYTKSQQLEPDTRLFAYTYEIDKMDNTDTSFALRKSLHDLPTNFFRDLNDEQVGFKADITIPMFNKDSVKHKKDYIKVGGSYSKKEREFNEYRYEMSLAGLIESTAWTSFNEANGDLGLFLNPNNAGTVDTNFNSNGQPTSYVNGNFYSDVSRPVNSYTGVEEFTAAYAMANYGFTDKLSLQGGVRMETTLLQTISKDTSAQQGSIDRVDFLPAFNSIYWLSDSSRLIAAFSKTLARPNMREISPFASVGGIGAPIVLGNPDLDRTIITNYDLRYEKFSKVNPRNVFAISGYYKNFKNPIIWLLTPQASTAEIKPVNVPTAEVYGVEFEIRRSLESLGSTFKNFRYGLNLSLIYSRVDKDKSELDALRAANRPDIEDYRPFQGQSPYIINALLTHATDSGWENTLSFNMWGDRLSFVTDALNPDVYEKSRPSLDFVSNKKISENFAVSFKVRNIFDMEYRQVFDYQDSETAYQSYRVGRTISFGLSYKFK